MTDRAWPRGLAIFCLALLVYIPSYQCGFIWDDDAFLYNNPIILSPDGLLKFWLPFVGTDLPTPPDYFPLTSTTLWVEWRLWGMDPLGYHVVNVLLHAGSCVLLWRVLLRLAVPGAFVAGLLFAVHPVCVESVTWITERKNVLPMVFYLAALLVYLRFEDQSDPKARSRSYKQALLLFLAALLSKTSVAILPVVLLGCAWWRRGTITRADLMRTAPFFAMSLVLGLVTVFFQYGSAIGETVVRDDSFVERLVIAGWAVWFYLYKALLPIGLCFSYPRWSADPGQWLQWVPLLLVGLCSALFWRARNGWGRPFVFSFGYYVLGLLPVIGFLDIYFMRYSLVSDHWQYTSLPAVVAMMGAGLAVLPARFGLARFEKALTAVVLAVMAVLTWQLQGIYENQETLWADTLAKNPDAVVAHMNLGPILHERGERDKAAWHYREALRLDPQNTEAHSNLGAVAFERGKPEEAIQHFRDAIRIEPKAAKLYTNLGFVLRAMGRFDQNLEVQRKAVEVAPDMLVPRCDLAEAYRILGREAQASAEYDEVLRRAPGYPRALHGQAWILATSADAQRRDPRRALELARRAVGDGPAANGDLAAAVAAAYALNGNFTAAQAWQEQAVNLVEPARRQEFQSWLNWYRQERPLHELLHRR